MRLVHITTQRALPKIREEGLHPRTHFIDADSHEIAAYYAETVRDEGERPARIEVDLADVLALGPEHEILAPDHGGIEEPLTYTLKTTEERVWEAWAASDQTWKASVDLIGTCRVEVAIPAHLLTFPGPRPAP